MVQGPRQSNGMCLAEFSVYSNLKPCASTDKIVDFAQVTSCGPGPVSLPGACISCGYFPGGLVGPLMALAQALILPTISTPQWLSPRAACSESPYHFPALRDCACRARFPLQVNYPKSGS